MKNLIDRLLKKTIPEPNSGCWLWIGGTKKEGYGQIVIRPKRPGQRRKVKSTHRVSYELLKGPIPAGMLVLHSCDMPCCINPDHLFLGTTQDNTDDMMAKGRHRSKGVVTPKGKAWRERMAALNL